MDFAVEGYVITGLVIVYKFTADFEVKPTGTTTPAATKLYLGTDLDALNPKPDANQADEMSAIGCVRSLIVEPSTKNIIFIIGSHEYYWKSYLINLLGTNIATDNTVSVENATYGSL